MHIEASASADLPDNSSNLSAHHAPDISNVDKAKVLRKMNLRIIPIVAILYMFSFLDRGYVRSFEGFKWV